METQEPTKQQNKDWRKQGLGWIPDYPDQRDLTLNNLQDELQENSLNSPIENITSNLLDLIRVLKNKIQENDIQTLEAKIEKQISDRQIFPEFKAYKRLQYGEKSEEVVQLKHYFNLLSSYNNTLKGSFTPRNSFESVKEYFEWLNQNDFDDKLEKIVSAFQQQVNIEQDGIVGLKTYTAIENYLSDQNYSGNIDNNQLALVSFLPLFSESVITVIFQTLDSWQRIQGLSNKEEMKKEAEIKTVFIDIFKDQFYVIEPITSVVGAMMLPLATSNSIEKVLKNSLDRFLNLFDDKINPSPTDDKINPSPTTISLAIQAIQEVHKNLNNEIKDLNFKETSGNHLETKEEDRLKFYNFLLPIIDKLDGMAKKLPLPQLPNSQSPKLPQRKYFLEIMIQNNSSDKEWIKPDKFNLPVTRTWYDKFLKLTNDQAKSLRYYCFLPRFVDLSFWCSPVRNQGSINSCAAFAGVALIEYFYKKNLGQLSQLSPLFLYKITRNLMGVQGDVGASVRSIMKAMLAIGVLKEQYWSYQEDKFDEEPPAFCYSVAQNNKILKYFRLDNPKISSDMLLFRIQAVLAVGTPCIFGFTVYSSFYRNDSKQGCIPFPSKQDIVVGGHTVVAVGYDDFKEIDYADGTNKSTGALLIRNSWGEDWGQSGYGWLPYDFVLKGLSADWWSLLQVEWLNVENVGFKRMVLGSADPPDEDQQTPQSKDEPMPQSKDESTPHKP